jgi:hypothetical protein
MARQNKYIYLWVVQGNYGYGHGWEDLCASEDRREAASDLRMYRQEEREFPHRLIQRRERNPRWRR